MISTKKIAQILALIFLALPLFSCKEGCVEPDEFDSESIDIESKPPVIYGTYDAAMGGQRVDWEDTALKSNGSEFLMQISGSWMSLAGSDSESVLYNLPVCNTCAKKEGVDNCICYEGQTPAPEKDPSGHNYTKAADGVTNLNCASNASHQDDAVRCTCTKQHGKATDYGIHHFPRDLLYKDETVKLADEQNNCRYTRGMGAYIALWGSRGVTTPTRVYHLFSEETACNIPLDSNGLCKDADGNDMTRYVFRSANSRLFMKDDVDGNDDIDNNTGNDVYHTVNEDIKTIMYDTYYSDNYGKYNVQILRGVGSSKSAGLLEFLVSLVEDTLLGEKDDNGERDGGIIKFMYMAVVQDSGFASVVQISLILYIAVFGAAHLWGLVEMNKKELLSRTLKIGLVVMFVSPQSWYLYDHIIVAFFKDSMDYVIGIFMTLADANIEQTSMIKVAQMDRVADESSATRFAYVDLIIRNLMSEAVAKKIAALLFSDFFGWFYILGIYALIFLFIAIMLYVATAYAINLIKLIFVLSLGPIFMVFTLFSKTAGYFNNWLGYLAGRSFEIIILFIVLYLFVTIIDKNFTEMLLYRVCTESWSIGPLKILIIKTDDFSRSFPEWLLFFVTIAGLIWITFDVINRLPSIAGALFSLEISGKEAAGGFGGAYSGGAVGGAMGGALNIAMAGASALSSNVIMPALSAGASGAAAVSRATGLSAALSGLPSGPMGMYGNNVMSNALNDAMKANGGDEAAARAAFVGAMRDKMDKEPMKAAAMGISEKSMAAMMDKKLVQEPLKGFIAQAAKEMKALPSGEIPLGKAAEAHIQNRALELAKASMLGSSYDKAKSMLEEKGMKALMRDSSALSASEAAKAFAGNKEKEDAYRAHLADKQFEQKQKGDHAWKFPVTAGIARLGENIYHGIRNTPDHNPGRMQRSFERGLDREKNPQAWYKENPFKKSDFLDKHMLRKSQIDQMTKDAKNSTMRAHLRKSQDQDTAKMSKADKKAAEKENQKNQFFRDELRKSAKDSAGYHPDRKGREDLLNNFGKNDGRTIFEKAAALDQYNRHLGIGGESAASTLAKMMRVEAQLAASKAKRGDKKAEERLKKLGEGVYGTELDEKVLGRFLKKESEKKSGTEPEDTRSSKEIDAELRDKQKDIQKQIEGVEASKGEKEKAKEQAKGLDEDQKKAAEVIEQKKEALVKAAEDLFEKNPSIVPQGISFDQIFGKGAAEALLKAGSITPEASNILPGGGTKDGKVPDAAAINAMKMSSNQAHGNLKLAKMNAQMKQLELESLDKNAADYAEKAAEISAEIVKINKEVQKQEAAWEAFEKGIAELQKGST